LLEYKKYKELSIHLGEKLEKYQDTFSRNFLMAPDECKKGEIKIVDSDLLALLIAYKKILTKLSNRIPEEIEGEEFTIEDKQNIFLSKLKIRKFIRFSDFFLEVKSKTEIVVTVMAMLEMIRNGDLKVKQTDLFGEIYIYNPSDSETEKDLETEANSEVESKSEIESNFENISKSENVSDNASAENTENSGVNNERRD
nr:segregation/condensation protein A [bacterium]